MFLKNKKTCAKTLSLAVGAIGVAVMFGWIWDYPVLKSISPSWVSMKFDTAIAFLLSGITLYFIVRAGEGELDKAQVALSISSMIIILLMGILLSSFVFKVHTGAEVLFVKDVSGGIKTPIPGQPSLPTMLNFFLIGLAGVMVMLNPGKPQPKLKVFGIVITAIGAIAVLGYAVDSPPLYYYIGGVNSAMAFNTAISFILLGTGFLCL